MLDTFYLAKSLDQKCKKTMTTMNSKTETFVL